MQFIDYSSKKSAANLRFLTNVGCGMVTGALVLIAIYCRNPNTSIVHVIVATILLILACITGALIRKNKTP